LAIRGASLWLDACRIVVEPMSSMAVSEFLIHPLSKEFFFMEVVFGLINKSCFGLPINYEETS
jgi:hypothetical protein